MRSSGIEINGTNFPDNVFRNYVSDNFNEDSDGWLDGDETGAVTSIYVSNMEITSLKGVELFTRLESLYCSYISWRS